MHASGSGVGFFSDSDCNDTDEGWEGGSEGNSTKGVKERRTLPTRHDDSKEEVDSGLPNNHPNRDSLNIEVCILLLPLLFQFILIRITIPFNKNQSIYDYEIRLA
jgi:hypothetical protein